jgi:uncharacterized protein YuzE
VKPQLEIDDVGLAAYVRIREGRVADTVEYTSYLFADYDASGNLLGVEILDVDSELATARNGK